MGVGVVAGAGEGVVDAEGEAALDDLVLMEMHEGGVDGEFAEAFDADFGGEVGEAFEGVEEFGPAVGVAGVIDGVDADEDVEGVEGFGPGEGEGEEDGVARGRR